MSAPDDLATSEGILSFVTEFVFSQARALFVKCGRVPMLAHLICTRGSEAGFVIKPGQIGVQTILVEDLPSDASKDVVAEVLRERARRFGAIGVIFVSEAWIVRGDLAVAEGRHLGSLEFHPQRSEGVFVTCEHIRAMGRWTALITRDAEGRGTLGDFAKEATQEGKGRFSDLLQRDRFA